MTWVPLNDLSRALTAQKPELERAVSDVIDSGWLVQGPAHRAFEEELAEYLGVRHVIGVGNGTDALEIALRTVLPEGRTTAVTAANCGAYTSVAARNAGLRVRYADVDAATHLLDPAALESVLDDEVGVVVVTHLYGRAADVAAVRAVCEPRGIRVLEDCAQAIGARTDAGLVGGLADVGTFSFYPTKNLGALGDGGAVVTNDDDLAERVRATRQYGWQGKYTITVPGGRNSRLDEVQAAVLRHRLTLVDEANKQRRTVIARYAAAASDRIRVLPADGPHHVGHLAVVETESAPDLIAHLTAREVRTDVHYPVPDHRQPAFAAEYADVVLPVTEGLVGRIVSLPCFPELTGDEIEQVCDALASY